jgi:precorrin-2 dehydrogenase / sirohydrochlorin ferrochelatase
MPLFPAFLKIEGRRCLVVGAGPVAEEKIVGLLEARAEITVVAPESTARIQQLAASKKIKYQPRKFRPADLRNIFLAVAATSSPALHAKIFAEARRLRVLCNVVDDPEHCDFYYGSVVRRGSLQIAISTEGQSPALAQRLRKHLEAEFGDEYAAWLEELGAIRKRLFAAKMPAQRRKELLHRLASEFSLKDFRRRSSKTGGAKNGGHGAVIKTS